MSSRRRPDAPGLRTFRFTAAGAGCEVVVGEGALRLLAGALPRIAPGRWIVVSSAPVLAFQGGLLREALEGAASVDPEIQALLDQRAAARKAKNWAESDRLRDAIAAKGWVVQDSAQGQKVRKA